MKDILPGGLADNMPDDKFDKKQLDKGQKVELEHTKDRALALEIAKDHLAENPKYYDLLEKMESKFENDLDFPIKQNYDFGGNYLHKIKNNKLAQINLLLKKIVNDIEIPNFYSPYQALNFINHTIKDIYTEQFFNENLLNITRDIDKLIRSQNRRNRVIKIAAIQRKIAAEFGKMPSFDWLRVGNLNKLANNYPEEFEEFIELNSNKFAIWSPVKYLGSGMIGDAWLLDDGKVLKIFDDAAGIGGIHDYEKIEGMQFGGTASTSFPRVYEYGLLEFPSYVPSFPDLPKIRYSKTPPAFKPAYAILERLETKDNIRKNLNIEHSYEYDEKEEDEIKYTGNFFEIFNKESIPGELFGLWQSVEDNDDANNFVDKFIETVFDNIISNMRSNYENYEYEYNEDNIDEVLYDFSSKDGIQGLADELSYVVDDVHSDETLRVFESILNLKQGWEKELAQAVVDNMFAGRNDLHAGNIGFRNNHFVFFDA